MTQKTEIEIALLLPAVPDARDACVQRLSDLLKGKEGIETAHLVEHVEQGRETLCIHYNPDRLSIGDVRDLAVRAGVQLDKRFGHLLLKSEPMYASQAHTVELRASQIVGVLEASASPSGILRIEFDRNLITEESLIASAKKLGLHVIEVQRQPTAADVPTEGACMAKSKDHDHAHGGLLGDRTELNFAVLCGACLAAGWLLSTFSHLSAWVPWSLYLAAYIFGGFFTFREAYQNIRGGRFEIDFLMLVAAVGAATLGEWAEGALLLLLFSLGHALEHYAMGRAKRAIEALAELAPQIALVRREGDTLEVPVAQLRPGDVVIVKPNERIAADGFVIQGEGSVNQAPITGESVPVDKIPVENRQEAAANPDRLARQYRTFAGTINGSGALEIQVTKLASDSTLARISQMVSEAETQKSPTQQVADKFQRYFVPAVLAFVGVLLFAWSVIDEPFSQSFYRAMAVLVAASPCALAISTPSAILSGIARAARGGVLVKGGGPLEKLGRVTTIAFDKTGTLTQGKPRLTDVVAADGVTEDTLLRVAVAVEALSDHPLASAIVRYRQERLTSDLVMQAQNVQSITGQGVKAIVDGLSVYVGKESLFTSIEGPPLPEAIRVSAEKLKATGRTIMIVRQGERYLGVLGLMDSPREAARDAIARLRLLGVQRMIMLSGDNQQVANAVAKAVGIDEAMGDLMPDDKVEAIKKHSSHHGVAMVGDGVNDAPAMANAAVGIVMGAAGSDVALEVADVALMSDDLSHLPFAVGLSRKTGQIIRQNICISLGVIAMLVPATLLGLHMGPAVVFHEGSTLLVVVNALRLLAYQAKDTVA